MSFSLVRNTAVVLASRVLRSHIRRSSCLTSCYSIKTSEKCHRYLSASVTMDKSQEPNLGNAFEDSEIQAYIDDIKNLIVEEALVKGSDRSTKVVDFKLPEDLKSLLPLDIRKDPANHKELLDICKTVIDYSVKTSNPRFFNQLYSGINIYGLTGAWLSDALNTNMHTFEVAPAFIVIEKYLIEKLCSIIGYKAGDGIFCPGGSFSNIMGMNLARYRSCPDFKKTGMYGMKRMKLYTSSEAHYSMVKSAVFLGLGSDNVVRVETDEIGRMKPEELEKKIKADIEKGEDPTFVMATSGTTVLGAFDQLNEIADVCEKYNIWLHCDACWGGGALLSEKHKHLMSGIERMQSVSWNLHKMSTAPLQCSALLIKDKGSLEECNRYQAEYLFQQDKFYDMSYDIGDKTVQCGRKVDALKAWLMWKALGDDGMTAAVDKAYDNARYLTEQLRKTEGFRLVMPEFQCTNIGFWYIPKSLRGQEETAEWWDKVARVAPKIKEGMVKQGTMLIGYQPLTVKGFVNFFRIIINNTKCDYSDMDFVVKEIDRLGRDL
ncbi:cysteine sulfinic acid decarboxylase-like isoform X2 [Mercenaria mercenaria]|nr:cysteine sulfinic acid decarboxylase-like isoform X2 [Mercenaria mercenaria]XP_045210019.2 cysteine sulfinic acid decarboxylase-like isoform X2 [Mercenaria mercenaria]XP_045210020.2 cysteine sulfinic acid decarboxylase-like isoform X2 [Mercenaria mercenaria]